MKTPIYYLVLKFHFLVCWNEFFIFGENSTKCWFPVKASNKLPFLEQILRSRNESDLVPYAQCWNLYSGV